MRHAVPDVRNDCFCERHVTPDSRTQVLSQTRKNHVCTCDLCEWVECSVYSRTSSIASCVRRAHSSTFSSDPSVDESAGDVFPGTPPIKSGSQSWASVRSCTVLVRLTPAALPTTISTLTDRTPRKMPSSHVLLRKSTFSPDSMPFSLAFLPLAHS